MIKARRLGFFFGGTSRFTTPESINFGRRAITLSSPKEPGIANDIINVILDDEYRVASLPHPPRTIIDIGANIGLFSLWAASNYPDARIHSYEPNERLWLHAQKNLDQVGATLYREGVGFESGFGRMDSAAESRLGKCELAESDGVPIIAFSDALARIGGEVDLLKMDCEGAEWDILQDTASMRSVKRVVMEYHLTATNNSLDTLVQQFGRMGFELLHASPNNGFGIACFQKQ